MAVSSLRLVLAASLLALAPAGAQTTGVVGLVRDSGGVPVGAALVTAYQLQVLTDSTGRFAFDGLPSGRITVSVRRLGYEPAHIVVELVEGRRDTLMLTLASLPRELPGMTTTADAHSRMALADFYRHRESGTGRYLDHAQLQATRAFQLSDVLRRMPGVRVSPDRNGRMIIRMGRSVRNCPPDVWLDNVRAPMLNVDDIPFSDIEAIEVYNGPGGLPPEYNQRFGNPACGAIVIWTRIPG